MLPDERKICVLISGQMRNFEQPLASLKRALSKFQPVYFISTWKKRGSKVIGAWHFDQLQRLMPLQIVRIFPYALMQPEPFSGIPALRRMLLDRNARSEDITSEIILDIIPSAVIKVDPDNLLEPKLEGLQFREPNAYRMLYKLKQCAEMVFEYEEKNQMSFNYFLRVRPDMLIPENLFEKIESLTEGSIFTDNANEEERTTGDSLAWGYRSDLDSYLALSKNLENNLTNQFYLDKWRNIHYELFDSISVQNKKLINASPSGHILEERISREALLNATEESMSEVDAAARDELICFKNLFHGIESLERHDYPSAKSHAEAALQIRSNSATAFHLLAQAHKGLGNLADAIDAAALSIGFASNFWGDDYLSDYFSDIVSDAAEREIAVRSIEKALAYSQNHDRLNAQLTRARQNDTRV